LNSEDPTLKFRAKELQHDTNGESKRKQSDSVANDTQQKYGPQPPTKKSLTSAPSQAAPPPKPWIVPGLVVRIVNKKLHSGKYYLKKGTIVDVFSATDCSVQLLEGNRLVEVKEDMLETVVVQGTKVRIVLGENKGLTGTVMQKLKDDAVVQLYGNLDLQKYNLDSICQYTGDDVEAT